MSTQDKLEAVLRDIHVLISKSEAFHGDTDRVILEKKKMFELLNRLNVCIGEMMDEYEVTKQSRDQADREARKKGDKIVKNASRHADDIYAASILYTNDALTRVQKIMQGVTDSMQGVFDSMQDQMKREKQIVRENQSELKGQLHDMIDSEKYIKLLEERNKQIEKELADEKEEEEPSPYAAVKPEIRVNQEYFERIGQSRREDLSDDPDLQEIDLEQDIQAEDLSMEQETHRAPEPPKIKINLESEYFKWKKNREKK